MKEYTVQQKEMKRMPAYKDKESNTWYVNFYYNDWTGEKKKEA